MRLKSSRPRPRIKILTDSHRLKPKTAKNHFWNSDATIQMKYFYWTNSSLYQQNNTDKPGGVHWKQKTESHHKVPKNDKMFIYNADLFTLITLIIVPALMAARQPNYYDRLWCSAGSKMPIHGHFLRRAILTHKVGQTDLVFGLPSGFITRSLCVERL